MATIGLLGLVLPAFMSATCNPKKHRSEKSETEPTVFSIHEDEDEVPLTGDAGEPSTTATPCPAPIAGAPPLGPILAPSCESDLEPAAGVLAETIGRMAEDLPPGLYSVGPANAADVGNERVLLKSLVLQGPPHCYAILAACEDDDAFAVTIERQGQEKAVTVGSGPVLQLCPEDTGRYDLWISREEGEGSCALSVFGD